MKKFIYFLIISCQLFLPLSAQVTFQKAYGGIDQDAGYSVQQTTDGGYIVAGTTGSFDIGSFDCYLVKIDANGDTLWTKVYGGIGYETCFSVQQTTDGGYILSGISESFTTGWGDVYLIKTNSSGDTLWTKIYGGSDTDWPYDVQQTADGGYIVTGYTKSFSIFDKENVYLIKTDLNGDTLWTKTYGGGGKDIGYSVLQTTDGGYIIAGYTESTGFLGDIYIIKTNANGDTIWTKTFNSGASTKDVGYSILQTNDGGYIISGYYLSTYEQVYLVKITSNGSLLWTKSLGNGNGRTINQTNDGGYIIAGYYYINNQADPYLIKTDANGNMLWAQSYSNETGHDMIFSVQQTNDGGYIMSGLTSSMGAGQDDVYLIKTDSNGCIVFTKSQNITINLGDSLIIDTHIYTISGTYIDTLLTSNGCDSIVTTKLTVLTGLPSPDFSNTTTVISPNPFSSYAHIYCYTTPIMEKVVFELYDMLGRQVTTHSLQSSSTSDQWNGIINKGNLVSGIYFYKISSQQETIAHGKLIIQ